MLLFFFFFFFSFFFFFFQVGSLKNVYHFALMQSGSESKDVNEGQEGRAVPRSGMAVVSEMPDKTAELNADQHVSFRVIHKHVAGYESTVSDETVCICI